MPFRSLMIALIAAALASPPMPVAADENGRVSHVTLYRNQAMVTRTLEVSGEAGVIEHVVSDLPETVVPDSLFAEGDEGLEVRAVQFRTRAVGESPREEVRELQKQLEDVADTITVNTRNQEMCQRQIIYLDSLDGFTAPTAVAELSSGVLDAEALEKITRFSFEQRETILARQVELAREARELGEQQSLLQRKLNELTGNASKTVREAVLFIAASDEAPRSVRLNYLVNACGWSPTYTMRANSDNSNVRVDYNGLIHQMTGEDWRDVQVTLSTASPALNASGPGIAPLTVTLRAAEQQQVMQQGAQIEQIIIRQKAAELDNRNAFDYSAMNESNWTLNDAANQMACATLFGEAGTVSDLQSQIEALSDEPSLSYKLINPVTLTSRNSRQMVRIVSTDLAGENYHVATPVLTNYVYRETQLVNNSSEDLLGGPIMVYLDDKFVGRGEIPTVARGQSFVVGLGADPQVRARRELVDKSEGINGGNRELKFEYRLVVENFSGEAAQVRIIDRMPVPGDGDRIRITQSDFSEPVSEDSWYQRAEKPNGILRWDLVVDGEANGDGAQEVEYGFTVEYDMNYVVTLPEQMNELKQDFERLQRTRTVR